MKLTRKQLRKIILEEIDEVTSGARGSHIGSSRSDVPHMGTSNRRGGELYGPTHAFPCMEYLDLLVAFRPDDITWEGYAMLENPGSDLGDQCRLERDSVESEIFNDLREKGVIQSSGEMTVILNKVKNMFKLPSRHLDIRAIRRRNRHPAVEAMTADIERIVRSKKSPWQDARHRNTDGEIVWLLSDRDSEIT